jgi:N-acetylglucosamine-6-sulfatase
MDRVGSEGAVFSNAFVTTSLCSPSRASFLTGRYAHQHQVRVNAPCEHFEESEVLWPQVLHKAGYKTAYFGKWHIGKDPGPRPGFDRWAVLPGQGRYVDPEMNVDGDLRTVPGHVDGIVGGMASEWLREVATGGAPFCLCVGFKSPHAPQTPPEELRDVLADAEIPFPESYDEDFGASKKADVVVDSLLRSDEFFDGPVKRKGAWEPFIKDFYRTIMSADRGVGRILEALDELGVADDTLVIFAGDNGFFLGEHNLIDKRFPYEEALRIPLLVRYPRRVKSGRTVSEMALNIDVCPTVLDACGVPVPANVAGRSLMPLLEGKEVSDWREDFFYEYAEREFGNMPALVAVRGLRYKYIEYLDPASTNELYDLQADPHEMRNVIDDRDYAAVLEEMQERLRALEDELEWTAP